MKKVSLDVWIQLIGMLSIVASLIFVGLEMRQSHRIAEAGQFQERSNNARNMINGLNEPVADWQSLSFDNNTNYRESLSKDEIIQRNIYHSLLFNYENDFFQYSQGLMPQEVWDAKLIALTFFYDQCNMRELIDTRRPFFYRNFLAVVNNIPDECAE